MAGLARLRPVELRGQEGFLGVGIRNRFGRAGEALEGGELAAPSLAHGAPELALEIAEIEERGGGAEFLAHEYHRHRGREQEDSLGEAQPLGRGEGAETLAQGAIAHLVVVLQERDEGLEGELRRTFPARLAAAMRRALSLIGESLGEGRRAGPDRGPGG